MPKKLLDDLHTSIYYSIVKQLTAHRFQHFRGPFLIVPTTTLPLKSTFFVSLPFKLNMVFTLPKLPWAEAALAPRISAETIQYHYGKHHAAYVNKLNGKSAPSIVNMNCFRTGEGKRLGKEVSYRYVSGTLLD